jgi:hypothetical protein
VKRSRLGPGKKSLERGSTFATRNGGLTRSAPQPVSEREQRCRDAFWQGGETALCTVCGAQGCDPHHIVTETRCRERARELGLDETRVAWDLRNRLWVCRRHHSAHHNASKRLTWELLERKAPKVFQFVRELDLEPWLKRRYPKSQREEQR